MPAATDVRQEDPLPLAVEGPTSRRIRAYGELTDTAQVVACRSLAMHSDPVQLGLARCEEHFGAAGENQRETTARRQKQKQNILS